MMRGCRNASSALWERLQPLSQNARYRCGSDSVVRMRREQGIDESMTCGLDSRPHADH
jgi:hypothetical protein